MNDQKKISVCHVSTAHSSDDDRIFLKECRSLAEAGYDVSFVVREEKNEVRNGVAIIALKKRTSRLSRMMFGPWEAYRKALRTKADIIHLHDPELLVLTFWFWIMGRKVVFDSHENVSGQIMSKSWLGPVFVRWIVSRCYRLFEIVATLFCVKVIGVIPEICSLFPVSKRVLLRNYPILALAKPDDRRPHVQKRIVYAGGLSRIRGIAELIQAVEPFNGNVFVMLMGKWNDDAYRKECESLPGWKYVDYLGSFPPDEVFSYYVGADIGAALLYPEPNYLQSLPVKAFEYMASALPTIMSDFPYWKANFTEGVVFVNPKDVQQISESIRRLVEDDEGRLSLGRAAREAALKKYSWEAEFSHLDKAYKEIVSGN